MHSNGLDDYKAFFLHIILRHNQEEVEVDDQTGKGFRKRNRARQ